MFCNVSFKRSGVKYVLLFNINNNSLVLKTPTSSEAQHGGRAGYRRKPNFKINFIKLVYILNIFNNLAPSNTKKQ